MIKLELDKKSLVPLHHQLYLIFEKAIVEERLKADEQLPTEEAVCDRLNISRPVIRQAYTRLIEKGLVTRLRGKGTFVLKQEKRGQFFKAITTFEEEMKQLNLKASTKVIASEIICDEIIAEKLGIDAKEPIFHLRRVRYGNNSIMVLVDNYIAYKLVDKIELTDFTRYSLYDVLRKEYRLEIQKIFRTFQAQNAIKEYASLLDIHVNDAIQFVSSLEYLDEEQLAIYSTAWYPGRKHQFEVVIEN